MFFKWWDTETRNLLYDFDTLDEVLEAARELVVLNEQIYPGKMALARVDGDSRTTWPAIGESLRPLLRMQDKQTA
jgi:hypothetical protein